MSEEQVEAEIAEGFFEQLKGLRFRGNGKMFFDLGSPSRTLVDTVAVKDELHLYFLDEDLEVVDETVLPPNRFYTPDTPYRYLFESFEELNLEEGEKIEKMKK